MIRALARHAKPFLNAHPRFRERLVQLDTLGELIRNTAATAVPSLIQPAPQFLTVAITANCNFRCVGCRYGRDYMNGKTLSTATVCQIIEDAAAGGMSTIRLYGGEPLLHPGLPRMVEASIAHGMTPFVSTNGFLLRRKLPELYDAGLRIITFGYYGSKAVYDQYVGRPGGFDEFEAGMRAVREQYGDEVKLHMSFVLNTRTCSLEELRTAWEISQRYQVQFHVDLVHYSLPYFTEGEDRELQFGPGDRAALLAVTRELLRLKQQDSSALYTEPDASIRSIPDWLLKGRDMEVPCDAYKMIWVGADGSVRMCYVTYPLGNIYHTRLRDLLFTPEHEKAAVDAFQLNCPRCHCCRDTRIPKHLASRIRYASFPDDDATPEEMVSAAVPGAEETESVTR